MYVRGGLGSRRIHDIIRVPNHVSCRWAAKHTNIENSYEIERENKKGVLVLPKKKKYSLAPFYMRKQILNVEHILLYHAKACVFLLSPSTYIEEH
jgi:hypothetical protein